MCRYFLHVYVCVYILVPNPPKCLQPDALAVGKTAAELIAEGVPTSLLPHKQFSGNRPSLSLLIDELTPFSLGQLLSLYEHRVAVQGDNIL